MDSFDDLPLAAQLERLEGLARNAAASFGLSPRADIVLINQSENTTYRVDDPDSGERYALRVHREQYHTVNAIRTELAWMAALRREAGVHTPVPVPGRDGELVQNVGAEGVPRPRNCVLFRWMEGVEPDEEQDLVEPFRVLGEVSGRIHRHSKSWQRPAGFERLLWDYDTTLGARPNWGRWQDGLALDAERVALLGRLSETIRRRLAAYGKAPERFGLIHADLRLANLLIHDGDTRVIDFDDSGLGWFLYDLATALSFMEERPDVPELIAAWLEGYRRVLPVSAEEEAEIPTFLMLRRLLILAWIGSHSETDLARELGPEYTAGTCRLAEKFLAERG